MAAPNVNGRLHLTGVHQLLYSERKLFVGMVSKRLNEDGIKKIFSVFGSIEDCTVLRDENGISKGKIDIKKSIFSKYIMIYNDFKID